MPTTSGLHIYIGTYTVPDYSPSGRGKGIYHYCLSSESGELVPAGVTPALSPSYLILDARGRRLFATDETNEFMGQPGSGVSAFAVDWETGDLAPLNAQPTHGVDSCHLRLDPTGHWLLSANYTGGSVSVFPVEADGRLGPAATVVHHAGSGPNSARQEAPHPHSTTFDPLTGLVLVADLGIDQLVIYRLDPGNGSLRADPSGPAHLRPGAGPRHLAFSRDGRYLYCSDELDSTVTVFGRGAHGGFEVQQGVSTVPTGYSGVNYPAHVQLSSDGRYLYVSNRGHDSIAVFSVDAATGALADAGHFASGGHWPRHFAIDPTGQYLLVANQEGESVAVLRVDPTDGSLAQVGAASVPNPSCVLIAG
jgi:6-phosphogluconolactonase